MGQSIVVTEKPSSTPGVVRFETNRALTGMGHERYVAGTEVWGDRPPDELARRLFARGGVERVHVNGNLVTVDLSKGHTSAGIVEVIEDLYRFYPDAPDDPGGSAVEDAPDPDAAVAPEQAPDPTAATSVTVDEAPDSDLAPVVEAPTAPAATTTADESAPDAGVVTAESDPAPSGEADEAPGHATPATQPPPDAAT